MKYSRKHAGWAEEGKSRDLRSGSSFLLPDCVTF